LRVATVGKPSFAAAFGCDAVGAGPTATVAGLLPAPRSSLPPIEQPASATVSTRTPQRMGAHLIDAD
jgi:hypothetical protein